MPYKIFNSNSKKHKIIKNIALLDVGRSAAEKQSNNENQYNLALGYLGAMLLKSGYNVLILQESPGDDTEEELIQTISNFSPDVIGFSGFSYNFKNTLSFKKKIESKLKKKAISIMGGIHASTSPENTMEYFDYIVFSEGEETLKELLSFLNKETKKKLEDIKGLYFYDKNTKLVFTGRRERIANLDKYGLPLRLFFNTDHCGIVTPIPDDVTGFAPIQFSRGCVRACSFCTNRKVYGCGKKARITRNPEKIAKEIEMLYNKNKINYFYTHDEDYTFDDEFMGRLADVLISYKKQGKIGQIYIAGMGSIGSFFKNNKVNKILIKKMYKAGISMIALGIERITNSDLNAIHKGTSVSEIHKVVEELFNSGIAPVALFIYCMEGDKKDELKYMAEQTLTIPAIRYRFAPAYPLKGTELRDKMNEDVWLDKEFKKDKYANCMLPVLKTDFCKSTKDASYQYLLKFPEETLRKIYSSEKYADYIRRFKKTTGKRFENFFKYKWKEILKKELGDIDFKW